MIRKFILAMCAFPLIANAQVNLAGVPENCEASLTHDMELANIPAILDLGPGAAKITSIQTMNNQHAYQYYPGLYRLDCYVTVRWSNGQVDQFYKFSAWDTKYGQTMVSYGR